MNYPRRPEVSGVLSTLAEGIAAQNALLADTERKARGWEKFAKDTVADMAEVRRTEFASGVALGFFVGAICTGFAWWMGPWLVGLVAVLS